MEMSFPRAMTVQLEDLNRLSVSDLEAIVSRTIGILSRSRPASDDAAIITAIEKGISGTDAHALYASLCSVLTLAARQDYSALLMTSALEENNVGSEAAKHVSKAFLAGKSQLRWMLMCTGIGQQTLTDFDWRLDYHVRSSATGLEHVPVYFVSLKTKAAHGEYGQKDFTCSHEHMQDMMSAVRDAIKSVERLTET